MSCNPLSGRWLPESDRTDLEDHVGLDDDISTADVEDEEEEDPPGDPFLSGLEQAQESLAGAAARKAEQAGLIHSYDPLFSWEWHQMFDADLESGSGALAGEAGDGEGGVTGGSDLGGDGSSAAGAGHADSGSAAPGTGGPAFGGIGPDGSGFGNLG